jgi:DNA gyrase subunit B
LIERGHVYIAQPPLYKVKTGKQESYVKGDNELSEYLLRIALQDAALHPGGGRGPVTGETLNGLVREFAEVVTSIRRLGRRYDERVMEQMIGLPAVPPAESSEPLALWTEALQKRLTVNAGEGHRYEVTLGANKAGEGIRLRVRRISHGVSHDFAWSAEFFASPEYQRIVQLGERLRDVVGDGAEVERGERRQSVVSFREAYEWLLAEARRGQHVQRYKGLGEMNPEQLWETTMDPTTRRLLQVRVEDGYAAENIFSTLMGDEVEPRRDFIERNALQVSNLDV